MSVIEPMLFRNRLDFVGVLKEAGESPVHEEPPVQISHVMKNMTITSSRPQRQCARFAFSYVERDDDEESMIM